MKTLITNSIFAAATLAIAAGTAAAQTTMRAEIPFAFRAGTEKMAPGAYEINIGVSTSRPFPTLRNLDSGKLILLPNFSFTDASASMTANGTAKLGFQCAETVCVLRELWKGGQEAYQFNAPKPHRGEAVRTAEVPLTPAKAD